MFIQPDFSIITNTENFKLNLKNEFNNYSIQVGVENITVDDFINKYIDNNTIGKTTKRLLKKYSD
ncbi:hypothetical protein D3C71_1941380 [compost metagenome]